AAYLCAPTAPTAVTAALGGPRWPGGPRSRPRGPRLDDPQPSLSPAEQHLESPVPSAPGALAGGPTQRPGSPGGGGAVGREIGAQLARMADDLNALYERGEITANMCRRCAEGILSTSSPSPSHVLDEVTLTQETRGTAATPPLALEGPVQSHHGTPALTQGPWNPRGGAQLGAWTRPVDVGDTGGRTLPLPDALASAGNFFCTM
ncbi:Bcl-2-binding component 3, partial [Camelus dromedarius]